MSDEAMVQEGRRAGTAGLFDIRNVIALLLGIYSLVLVGVGVFDRSATADLWTGLGLAAASAVFTWWAVRRPVEHPGRSADTARGAGRSAR